MKLHRRIAHLLLVDIPMMKQRHLYSVGFGSHLGLRFKIAHSVQPANREYVKIGNSCLLNCQIVFESQGGHVSIGNNTNIGNSTIICHDGVTIGNNVTMAWGITVYDHDSHSLDAYERRRDHKRILEDTKSGCPLMHKDWESVKAAPIVIKDDAWIGMNAIVLKGVTVGVGSVIGAGSVVTRDVPDYCVAAGNPARIVKKLEEAR